MEPSQGEAGRSTPAGNETQRFGEVWEDFAKEKMLEQEAGGGEQERVPWPGV